MMSRSYRITFPFTKVYIVRISSVSVPSDGSGMRSGILWDIIRAFPKLIPIVLAHHPDCKPYRNDVIKIGKVRLCRGCTISFGIAGIMILIYLLSPDIRTSFDRVRPVFLFSIGVFLGLFQVLRAVFRKIGVAMKTIVKVALGLGIGLIAIAVFELDLSIYLTIWIFIGLFILYGLLGGPLRFYYMKRTCEECEFKADLDDCEGLKIIKELE